MTTRERWIVYPLLMFSLMMGIKTRYYQDTFMLTAEKIQCGELTVTLINGRPAKLTAIIPRIRRPNVQIKTADESPSPDDEHTDVDPSDEPTGSEPSAEQPSPSGNAEGTEPPDVGDEGNDAS